MEVTAEGIEQMNLLGLFMKAALEERLEALTRAAPTGVFAIESGGMGVTLSFERGRVVIRKGTGERTDARLTGDLDALAQLARGKLVDPLLRRRIKVSGNLVKLLPLARVFA